MVATLCWVMLVVVVAGTVEMEEEEGEKGEYSVGLKEEELYLKEN